jgi:peptidoglycan/LPS O-acetylase OafA/YrhL
LFYNAWPDSRVLAYHSVSWSLGYEFAFYLAVPVVALLTRRFDARLVGIGLFAAVSLALPDPFLRMNGLFLGALIGCFTDASLRRAVTNVPMELCLLLYLSISVAKGFLHLKFATYLWLFLPVSALLFCKIVFDGGQLGRALSASPLRRLGTVSYSFYLYHTTIISLMLHVVLPKLGVYMHRPVYVPMLFVFSLLASILAAKLSYRLFEQPYFRRKP